MSILLDKYDIYYDLNNKIQLLANEHESVCSMFNIIYVYLCKNTVTITILISDLHNQNTRQITPKVTNKHNSIIKVKNVTNIMIFINLINYNSLIF